MRDITPSSPAPDLERRARDGALRRAWRGVKVPGHAEPVLAAARALAAEA